MRPWPRFLALLLGLLLCATTPLHARVLRIEIQTRTPVANGRSFGRTGAYERLAGKVYFSVAVANPHNARIVDLHDAVNLHDGEVAFAADFTALRPLDAAHGNGSLLLEIPNRGRAHIVALVDGATQPRDDIGDGWLLKEGYTVVSLGWQWDAAGTDALRLYAPMARAADGSRITGLLRGDLMPARPLTGIPLGHLIVGEIGGVEYPVADPDDARNTLTVRDTRDASPSPIARSEWRFAQPLHGQMLPSDSFIHLGSGFQPGRIYEYVYVVADPVLAGLGFAAVRDFASWVKHAADAPLHATRVHAEGISQDGRFLRDFLYQGFNADEEGNRALDGVLAHVAGAGRGSFNLRFAQPSRDAQPTSSIHYPTDMFPFTDLPETDPLTGETAGLLDRARADRVMPRIFFSNTSYEYWGRCAALTHVSADGQRDVALSPELRIYFLAGLQHFSIPFPPTRGEGDLLGRAPESPLPVRWFWRAMITNLDAWVRRGTEPPPSRYPRLDAHTLVPLADWHFPPLPGVAVPGEASVAWRLDFGPRTREGILDLQPPRVGATFPVLVPQVDPDGNDRGGVRLPELDVPLATYTGWNLRDPAIGAPTQRVAFEGSWLPFPRTRREARARHDPRSAILERYRDRDDYLTRYSRSLDRLVRERWVLEEDRPMLMRRGTEEWEFAMQSGRHGR